MKAKKLIFPAACAMALSLALTAGALADGSFNVDIGLVTNADGSVTVTVEDSSVLTEKKPSLQIAFNGKSASVLHEGEVIPATVESGTATFQVDDGGSYTVVEGQYSLTSTVEPGCTDDGEYVYTGPGGKTYTETIPATGHDFSDRNSPTCLNCGEPNPNYVPPYTPPAGPDEDGEPEPVPPVFGDVGEDEYYADAVSWAVNEGITEGTGEGMFSPDNGCSRAEVVTFLWRAAGCPEPDGGGSFSDVAAGSYYEKAVQWAADLGITEGTGSGEYSPELTVTRAQFVTFLWRLAGSPSTNTRPFADVPEGAYYSRAVAWAVANGITDGTGEDTFSPDSPCTRAQVVTFIYRYYN